MPSTQPPDTKAGRNDVFPAAEEGKDPTGMAPSATTAEERRLAASEARQENWQRWGTYLPERQWGTVREDYSAEGNPWSFTHDLARFRAYRWGEDGLLGWTDRECRLCLSTSLWNGEDPILKERLFGLSNSEGNHGEDVKELYYYLDATPTHSYAKALYKYPQRAFPYGALVRTNAERGYNDREFELLDTGIFDENRYFDVQVEYAKRTPDDVLLRITVSNRGPEPCQLHVLPTLVLRNTWSWEKPAPEGQAPAEPSPRMYMPEGSPGEIAIEHKTLGRYVFSAVVSEGEPAPQEFLFTENDSNFKLLDPRFQGEDRYAKDAFHRYLVEGEQSAVNPAKQGTKAAQLYRFTVEPGGSTVLRLRLRAEDGHGPVDAVDVSAFDECLALRTRETDEFYAKKIPEQFTDDQRAVSRQAFAGLLWTKQFYYYVAERWLEGDAAQPTPPAERLTSPNADWRHLFCRDVLSMPDKWEYPWFAAWDLAFQMVPMVQIDPAFAKNQLLLLLREWYLHPNGQIPAYEGKFSDVNPPVHAFAVYHVYEYAPEREGGKDVDFLERAFQKLLLNFTWWVNRNDAKGRNLFGGGFLGLDNIGVFNRSQMLPKEVHLNQADGTAWMGLYCSAMLRIAMELAQTRPVYEDIASKFFEHYINIIDAINEYGGSGLWDEEEGFYFDQLIVDGQEPKPLKVHSFVGLVPLLAITALPQKQVENMPGFKKRMEWFLQHRVHLGSHLMEAETDDRELAGSKFLALLPRDRLARVLSRLFDEKQFLSEFGVRSVSRLHLEHPFEIELAGEHLKVGYVPEESDGEMFGGNSNWRGPVWFPINVLIINALQRYHAVYGEHLKIECPTGSGKQINLLEAAAEIARRLGSLFLKDENGRRPCFGEERRYQNDPFWRDLILFNEYFSAESGRGLGASHQTGWTALVAICLRTLTEASGG